MVDGDLVTCIIFPVFTFDQKQKKKKKEKEKQLSYHSEQRINKRLIFYLSSPKIYLCFWIPEYWLQ
jgi:hypothetical protein